MKSSLIRRVLLFNGYDFVWHYFRSVYAVCFSLVRMTWSVNVKPVTSYWKKCDNFVYRIHLDAIMSSAYEIL